MNPSREIKSWLKRSLHKGMTRSAENLEESQSDELHGEKILWLLVKESERRKRTLKRRTAARRSEESPEKLEECQLVPRRINGTTKIMDIGEKVGRITGEKKRQRKRKNIARMIERKEQNAENLNLFKNQ